MKQRILNHASILVVVSVLVTFIAASSVLYGRYAANMKQGVRDEAKYVQIGIDEYGEEYLTEKVGDATETRITLVDKDGIVLYDSDADAGELPNHGDRPEIEQAQKDGTGESIRYSETFSRKNFNYAVELKNGHILRVSKSTDSIFPTMMSSFTLLGVLMIVILLFAFFFVQRQTKELIEPINGLDLERPLDNVCYEELRPLLMRVDQQNKQIARQVEELKSAEAMRREFSANVSHELKTPLMSISGYAELMMNGMVQPENVPEFSGRIYHEAVRLSSLVADIIQLSRMDEKSSDMPFEAVDLYELSEDIVNHLQNAAMKKKISLSLEGETVAIRGVRHVLYEMFYNLADNAVRYTDEGGAVKISVGKQEGQPFYTVEDNGIGIPANEQNRIFERFYRVDKSHSRQTGGTGLGLSIVKHGAVLHHAKINLESEPGKGTKMTLLFSKNKKVQ